MMKIGQIIKSIVSVAGSALSKNSGRNGTSAPMAVETRTIARRIEPFIKESGEESRRRGIRDSDRFLHSGDKGNPLVGAGRFERPTPCAQGRCATRLRYAPTFCCFFDSKPLSKFPILSRLPKSSQNNLDRGKTVTKPHQLGLTVSKPGPSSLAFRFNFCRASRFICNFICEYFLNTFASPCRSNCVTHSSATPPALKRVA